MKRAYPNHIRPYGERALLLEWPLKSDPLHRCKEILSAKEHLLKSFPNAECIPGIDTLTFLLPEGMKVTKMSIDELETLLIDGYPLLVFEERKHELPVCYDPPYAPDMEFVCKQTGLTTEEIIRLHSSREYTVFMIGFLPGFAYLGELNPSLQLSRKPSPMQVVAGSVAIAGRYTAVYPIESPGGWHIIGRTNIEVFNSENAAAPCLLNPLDKVVFRPVGRKEFESGTKLANP